MGKSENEKLYVPADDWFVINLKDSQRKPIYVSLPKPPPIELIDGYGLHPDDQYFRRIEEPPKLMRLQESIIRELQDRKRGNYQETVTPYKIISMLWDEIENNPDDYEEEVVFIKKFWWYRINGYWFFNDGKPTYITGRHLMFLQFFYMTDVKENKGFPEYRDRHRREYLCRDYLRVAHHTFAKRDDKGWAIAEEDGHYKMIDMGIKLFFGDATPKSRRNGSTSEALSDCIEDAERKRGAYSTIVSKGGEDSEEHYNLKLLPAWSSRPYYLKPVWEGNFAPTKIKYRGQRNDVGAEALMSMIDYCESAGEVKKDGSKFSGFVCYDEEGKTSDVDVLSRWNVYKNNMSLGDGTKIIGFGSHITTVESINSSGQGFLDLLDLSDFYQRGDNGQTSSGLAVMIFPSYDGLEGCIDRFGMSVIGMPTERQSRLRPDAEFAILKTGAHIYQSKKRDDLLKIGTPQAMKSYREYVKKYPWDSSELTIGTAGDIGFSYEVIDKRMAELRRIKSLGKLNVKVGNFYRKDNHLEGDVYWKTEEGGRFEISMDLPPEQTNLKRRTMGWDVEQSKMIPQWEPIYKSRFICGCDPFEYSNQKADTGVSKQSDGGIAILRERDESIDKSDYPSDWHTRSFILTYRYRPPSSLSYNEDVLMACEYYGCMVFMERNKTGTWEHFIRRGRGGFLRFEMDLQTGKMSDKPGYYAQGQTKDELFAEVKDYIEFRGYEENHLSFLEECREIKSKDALTKFDRLAAHGAALLGSKSPHGKIQDKFNNTKVELGACSWLSQ